MTRKIMFKSRTLRALVTERLTAAAEEIFTLFERTLAEYEEELGRSQQVHPAPEQQHPWEQPGRGEHPAPEQQHPWEQQQPVRGYHTWVQPRELHPPAEQPRGQTEEQPRRGEHPWEQPGREEHPWEQPGREEHLWEQPGRNQPRAESTWTGPGVQLERVKQEPDEQFRAVCVKTEELLQLRDAEDDWEPFSCSDGQIDAAALHSGVQLERVKEEPDEQLIAVCVKTEDPLGLSDTEDDWEPFSWSDTTVNSGVFPESSLGYENTSGTSAAKYQCPLCPKTFGTKSNLQRHGIVHSGEKPFSCSLCSKSFNTKSYLVVHMRSHTGERPYSCPFCGKGFSHKSAFNFHVQTHNKDRPFSCSVCTKSFKVEYYLKVHMKTHSRERPYSCSLCGARFTQKSSLNIHMRTHSGERPFRCSVCAKGFTLKHNLGLHMRTHSRPCSRAAPDPAAAQVN